MKRINTQLKMCFFTVKRSAQTVFYSCSAVIIIFVAIHGAKKCYRSCSHLRIEIRMWQRQWRRRRRRQQQQQQQSFIARHHFNLTGHSMGGAKQT
jgi:hypothetical protein